MKIVFNGAFLKADDLPISIDNRAFRYGDGLFETIRMNEGQLLFVDHHFERLISGMYALGFETTFFNPLEIAMQAIELASMNNHAHCARIRLSVFRDAKGFYKPDSDKISYLIQTELLESQAYFSINEKGLRAGLFSDIRKPINMFSGIKSANALLYVMAARHAREQSWDESILLNDAGRICEGSASNLFLVLPGEKIITPAQSEGILPGVMRRNVIDILRTEGLDISETQVMMEDFYKADEVFLTNAIQGIQWVISFRERRYFSKFSRKLISELNRHVSV